MAAGCIALAVLSHLLTRHGGLSIIALANLLVGILVIGVTAYLALQNQSAQIALREKAGLLDLTHDTMFVRDMNDVITFWNWAAEELYGWKEAEAIGRMSSRTVPDELSRPAGKDQGNHVPRWTLGGRPGSHFSKWNASHCGEPMVIAEGRAGTIDGDTGDQQ